MGEHPMIAAIYARTSTDQALPDAEKSTALRAGTATRREV
jgi:hypothetical protein